MSGVADLLALIERIEKLPLNAEQRNRLIGETQIIPPAYAHRVSGRDENGWAFVAWADMRRPIAEQFPGCSSICNATGERL